MDEAQFELAQRVQEERLQQAIANRVQYQGESAEDCDSCGVDIPQARRLAVPGCQFCVDCQGLREVRR
ncbi:TraR/DksA C4-type zinc finger protein [Pseudomonas anguilliseptica]|uniref:Transcriptional regulator, TraR/DksA family n=1 Tax=Pseudomonas anguilliseptica TaxID=53406 RepID=A0A1H4UW72_PSEAG|nr:TraR/DksA C4-type zinc finger protein [Pseudomonas anguilliseptica]SEC72975.1 transcriptional regulator, TraR/DksA family [Pseudomonas anguilliseptica]